MKKIFVITVHIILLLFFTLLFLLIPRKTDICFEATQTPNFYGTMKSNMYFSGNKIYTKTHCISYVGEKKLFLKFFNAKAFAARNDKFYYLDNEKKLNVSDSNNKHLFQIDNVEKFALYNDKIIVLTSQSFDSFILSIFSHQGVLETTVGAGSIYDFCVLASGKILYREEILKTFFVFDIFRKSLMSYPISIDTLDKGMYYTYTKDKFLCNDKYVIFYEGFWDSNCIVMYDISKQKNTVLLFDKEQKYDIKAELLGDILYYSCKAVDIKYFSIEQNEHCGTWKIDLITGERNKISKDSVIEFLVVNGKMLGVSGNGMIEFLE